MPSTMTRIFFQGRRVRGAPIDTASRSTASNASASLCLKERIRAPDARQPLTMDAWLSSSETTRSPLPTSAGTVVLFVP